MTARGASRRRRVAAAFVVAATIGSVIGATEGTGVAAPNAREHIRMWKLCPRAASDPVFLITNVTDDPGKNTDHKTPGPETITAYIVRGGQGGPAVDLDGDGAPEGEAPVLAVVPLAPGESQIVHVSGPWSGPHYVYFTALYRDVERVMRTRQYCGCDDSTSPDDFDDTTTIPTSTTVPPSTTSTTVPPTTTSTTVPPTTTSTTVPPTTTSTTVSPSTTSTTVPPTTTSTTVPPSTTTPTTTPDS